MKYLTESPDTKPQWHRKLKNALRDAHFRINVGFENVGIRDYSTGRYLHVNIETTESEAKLWLTHGERNELLIFASKHTIEYYAPDTVTIGCHTHTIAEWLKTYIQIGKENNYTESEITEYHDKLLRIKAIAKILNR